MKGNHLYCNSMNVGNRKDIRKSQMYYILEDNIKTRRCLQCESNKIITNISVLKLNDELGNFTVTKQDEWRA